MKKKCYLEKVIAASLAGAVVLTSSGVGKMVALANTNSAEVVLLDETTAEETSAGDVIVEGEAVSRAAAAVSAGDTFQQVSEYDKLLKNYYEQGKEISKDTAYEQKLLQREFVNNVGYDALEQFAASSEDNKKAVDYLLTNLDALRYYVLGGAPDGGNYTNSLTVFSELFKNHSEDLNDVGTTKLGTSLSDLWLRMMISLSLTHSYKVGLWTQPGAETNGSSALKRYEIYKTLHGMGKLQNDIFENLCVEEMRFVMNNIIDDEEIMWVNDYTTKKNKKNPYDYIKYGAGYNYYEAQYYDKANYDKWDAKYNLGTFGISYQSNNPKLWIVMEEGAVCGGISKLGSNIWGSYGVPSSVISQPGHAAYIYYDIDKDGNGKWVLMNNIFGWAKSGRTERLTLRMPNGWGSGKYASQYPVGYIFLTQAALNEYDSYVQAEEQLMLAKVFADDQAALSAIYQKALQTEKINFDAWYGTIELYAKDTTKTENDWYALAEKIAGTLKYYPLPMYDLLRMIQPHLKSADFSAKYTELLSTTLNEGAAATAKDVLQPDATQVIAKYLIELTTQK